ncbi:YceI family protein [Vibrio palustris]|uniref:Lipid/polyisoprenoid-binding YceI-like domain-containing protein n=1 Tax=Vibrio palustris TaxID=1918946 RepID=A0A1R4B3A5_9VIBR|nr:YceI family protein [Vibrio palustris]SJL83398.1 hypothetical protein VPAL9027_01364 [Vibrio palustris]
MNKRLLALTLACASFAPLTANAADYVIDTKGAHAAIHWQASHLGYSYNTGRFNTFSGTFSFDPEHIEKSTVNVTVKTDSIDSNHAERDKHLRSDEFINAEDYPTAKFSSTKVVSTGDKNFDIKGNLTLHGETAPITIHAHLVGAGDDPWGGERAGFTGTTTLNLADFNIDAMGMVKKVDLELFVEGVKQG